jgi:hypothetical protein
MTLDCQNRGSLIRNQIGINNLRSALPLPVARIPADDAYHALAPHDLAVAAHALY